MGLKEFDVVYICFGFDSRIYISINSLLDNLLEDEFVNIHIIIGPNDNELDPFYFQLNDKCKIHYYKCNKNFLDEYSWIEKTYKGGHESFKVKLLLHKILPSSIEKICFFDTDIFFIKPGFLTSFFNEIGDNVLISERDLPMDYTDFDGSFVIATDNFRKENYFNFGVFGLNLKKYEQDFFENLLKYTKDCISKNIKFSLNDQDLVNNFFNKTVKIVSNIYNRPMFIHTPTNEDFTEHWTGTGKNNLYYHLYRWSGKNKFEKYFKFKGKVSIITPFYNTPKELFENYFNKLQLQEFTNFEVILVNDASTDQNSINQALEFCKKDSRFKLIHNTENQKQFLSRKNGLKESSGDYILFLDSDDWLTPRFLKSAVYRIESKQADAVYGEQIEYNTTSNLSEIIRKRLPIFDSKQKYYDKIGYDAFDQVISLFKRDLYKQIETELNNITEKLSHTDDSFLEFMLYKNSKKTINLADGLEYKCYSNSPNSMVNPANHTYESLLNQFNSTKFVTDYFIKENKFINQVLFFLEEWKARPLFAKKLSKEEQSNIVSQANLELSKYSKYYKIPKLIHYIWLSDNEKPKNIQDYINKNFNINYLNNGGWEIKIWSYNDFPEEVKNNKWFQQTYNVRNWAACSDYLRLWLVYNYGGFYFDSDVETVNLLSRDWPYEKDLIFGLQYDGYLECGVFGASPGNKHIKKLLDWYNDKDFNPDWMVLGKSNSLPEPLNHAKLPIYTAPNLWTNLLATELQNKKIELLPPDILSACDYTTKKVMATENTVTIHHFAGGWLPKKEYNLTDFGFN